MLQVNKLPTTVQLCHHCFCLNLPLGVGLWMTEVTLDVSGIDASLTILQDSGFLSIDVGIASSY